MERFCIVRRLIHWPLNQVFVNEKCLHLRNIQTTDLLLAVNWRRERQKMLVKRIGPKIIQANSDISPDEEISSADLLAEDEPVIKPSDSLKNQRFSLDSTSLAARLAIKFDQHKSSSVEKEETDSLDLSLQELERKIKSIKSDLRQLKFEPENMDPDYELKQMLLGKSDPSVKPSNVPCGGCGANLHCTNPLIPGFMPTQDFKESSIEELGTMKCMRCKLMSKNQFLKLDIDEKAYQSVIDRINDDKKALVIMLVDVTDIANTLIEGYIKDMVKSKPVIIVGNKIDLIPPDATGHKHLTRIRDRILDECYRAKLDPGAGDIKDLFLISAKTGFGIEDMINKLVKNWRTNGNVYLVGTTNSGKSTLFNKFLESDYCKSSCRDVVQRATISRWPGTTFDLLKFPLARLSHLEVYLRMERIKKERMLDQEMVERNKKRFQKEGLSKNVVLFGSVGKTDFRTENKKKEDETKFIMTGQKFSEYTIKENKSDGGKPAIEFESSVDASMFIPTKRIIRTDEYPDSQWVFDTPGLINSEQLLNDMTADELQIMLKMQMIRPRVFTIQPGHTMFITGMARIDYLKGKHKTLATVHLQHLLPIRVVKTEVADQFYEEHLKSDSWDEIFKMPILKPGRLETLPPLKGEHFTFPLDDYVYASVDVQLSSLGWVSFAGRTREAEIKVYTPGGKGIHLRTPAMLPNILTFKGVRIKGTQAYAIRKIRPRTPKRTKSRFDLSGRLDDQADKGLDSSVSE